MISCENFSAVALSRIEVPIGVFMAAQSIKYFFGAGDLSESEFAIGAPEIEPKAIKTKSSGKLISLSLILPTFKVTLLG